MSATKIPAVIARLDRAIQYSKASVIDPRKPGVLDAPHARGMTGSEAIHASDVWRDGLRRWRSQ